MAVAVWDVSTVTTCAAGKQKRLRAASPALFKSTKFTLQEKSKQQKES
jgi:hypothetical protein